jgi:hypothetical protein
VTGAVPANAQRGSKDGKSGMVLQFREREQGLWEVPQQDRGQPIDGLLHRPDCPLMLASEHLDAQGLVGDLRDRAVQVSVVPQDACQHRGVTRIGLLPSLTMANFALDGGERSWCGGNVRGISIPTGFSS